MTTETDQTVGQLDEATVLRVLGMLQEMVRDADAAARRAEEDDNWIRSSKLSAEASALSSAATRLVALYRASPGLEEA